MEVFRRTILSRERRRIRRHSIPGIKLSFPWAPVFLWLAFVIVGAYIVLFSPALMIEEVSIEGNNLIPANEYSDFVRMNIEGTYIGILNRKNYFLLPTQEVRKKLLEQYPILSHVTIERRFPNTLHLSLQEAPKVQSWCSGGPCYGVRDGRAVGILHAEDGRYASSRIVVIDESALPVVVGAPLPVESYLDTLYVLQRDISQLTGSPVAPVAVTPSRYSNELTLEVAEGWHLLVAVNRPSEESLGTLQTFLTEYAKEHSDRSMLDSVDLRIEGKIFYTESDSSIKETKQDEDARASRIDAKRAKEEKRENR